LLGCGLAKAVPQAAPQANGIRARQTAGTPVTVGGPAKKAGGSVRFPIVPAGAVIKGSERPAAQKTQARRN